MTTPKPNPYIPPHKRGKKDGDELPRVPAQDKRPGKMMCKKCGTRAIHAWDPEEHSCPLCPCRFCNRCCRHIDVSEKPHGAWNKNRLYKGPPRPSPGSRGPSNGVKFTPPNY